MGNTFFCNRCDIEKFQLSQACADQFLNEDDENPLSSEARWRDKLRCLDDAHSKINGLTVENFNALFDELEKDLNVGNIPVYCTNRERVLQCLRRNPRCSLNCQREMNEFIDCVDTERVKKIKERIQESMKGNRTDLNALFT